MKIHGMNYCEIPTGVIKKPKCLHYNKLILESGNKIRTVWRTVKLETGEYSTEEEDKLVMMYAKTIQHLDNVQHEFLVFKQCFLAV
jgi:predicted lactoylglutathione lyase